MAQQLSLRINLNDDATFENFYLKWHGSQQCSKSQAVSILKNQFYSNSGTSSGTTSGATEEPFVYLWGASGSGVSHLLQASCHQASVQGLVAQYLPLKALLDYPPQQLLDGLEQLSIICLDDLQVIAGDIVWEEALFDLFNRIKDVGGRLLLGANCSVRDLPLQLPDLQSRFGWGAVFKLSEPEDDEKMEILQFRASRRGMVLSDDVAQYWISRATRNLGELMSCLDELEKVSLQEGRKLSIPFIKQVFNFS